MVPDVADVADGQYVGAELLLDLQVVLVDDGGLEVGTLRVERERVEVLQVRDIGCCGYGQTLIEGAVSRGALAIANAVAGAEKVGFDLNRYRRLAVGLKVREEGYVLQIGVGGVVPREVADTETAADDRPRAAE